MKKLIPILLGAFLLVPVASADFIDLPEDHPNKEAIDYLEQFGVLRGDPDGRVRPDDEINRAEFMVVLGRLMENQEATWPTTDCFMDVADEWFAADVCEAKHKNIIAGYPDGKFRPWETINLAEALKIIVNVLDVPTQESVETPWYQPYAQAMSGRNYLPDSFYSVGQKVARDQMAEMVWRVLLDKKDQPFTTVDQLAEGSCRLLGHKAPSSIDMDRFRDAWLGWLNEARATQGLAAYSYNPQLHRTATDWSNLAATRGYIDHRRNPGDVYYDYWKITDWFAGLGLTFKNVNRVTHTENIGWDIFKCDQADCTDTAISRARNTFDFYMAEGPGGAHYNSIMNGYFKEIGVGIAVAPDNKFYITTHYGTEITSHPEPVCEFL